MHFRYVFDLKCFETGVLVGELPFAPVVQFRVVLRVSLPQQEVLSVSLGDSGNPSPCRRRMGAWNVVA